MASTVYRLAVLQNQYRHVPQAENVRKTIFAANSSHIDSNGWLTPVVDPINFSAPGSQSPESEAFILLLHSAYIDWNSAGAKGANAGTRAVTTSSVTVSLALFGSLLSLVAAWPIA
jgi:hypothetical protein